MEDRRESFVEEGASSLRCNRKLLIGKGGDSTPKENTACTHTEM
jgi:hypothetical protein